MKDWSTEEEAFRLAERFIAVQNQAQFARDHLVPGGPSMISQHITGHRPISLSAARAYAKGFGVSLAEISPRLGRLAADDPRPPALKITEPPEATLPIELVNEPESAYIRLPLLGEAAAGAGRAPIDSDGEVVRQVEVLESWIRQSLRANPKNLSVLTARGHSMRGVVEDGDVLFVEPCTEFRDDGLYVLSIGDLVRVKRLRVRVTDRQLSIESTDGSAPELVPLASVGETILIQGRVVGAWGLRQV